LNDSSTTGLIAFAKQAIRTAWSGGTLDSGKIQEMAEIFGLVAKLPDSFDVGQLDKDSSGSPSPGEWYTFIGPLAPDFPEPLAHMEPDNG